MSLISSLILEQKCVETINQAIDRYCSVDDITIQSDLEAKVTELTNQLKSIQGKIDNIEHRLEVLYSDKVDGIITTEEYLRIKEKYLQDSTVLKEQADILNSKIDHIKNSQTEILSKQELFKRYGHIETLSRSIVEDFIDEIVVYGKTEDGTKVDIKLKI
jgi:hypothetical protein